MGLVAEPVGLPLRCEVAGSRITQHVEQSALPQVSAHPGPSPKECQHCGDLLHSGLARNNWLFSERRWCLIWLRDAAKLPDIQRHSKVHG